MTPEEKKDFRERKGLVTRNDCIEYFESLLKSRQEKMIEAMEKSKRHTETEICPQYVYDSYFNQGLDKGIEVIKEYLITDK